jgi:transposase
MMGLQAAPERLFYDFCLEDHVPPDHLLRQIDWFLDLGDVRAKLAPFYCSTERPSIDPSPSSTAIMQRQIAYCGENHEPGRNEKGA